MEQAVLILQLLSKVTDAESQMPMSAAQFQAHAFLLFHTFAGPNARQLQPPALTNGNQDLDDNALQPQVDLQSWFPPSQAFVISSFVSAVSSQSTFYVHM